LVFFLAAALCPLGLAASVEAVTPSISTADAASNSKSLKAGRFILVPSSAPLSSRGSESVRKEKWSGQASDRSQTERKSGLSICPAVRTLTKHNFSDLAGVQKNAA
jgi:hypothetical protein